MPTKRRRHERFRLPDIDPVHWAILTDAEPPEHADAFAPFTFDRVAPHLWELYRERILRDWIATSPGTRPSCWWRFDAPRDPSLGQGCHYQPEMIQGRLLLEGEGRPAWEELNLAPQWDRGVPAFWYGADPATLVFESQYDYLQRHGLLEKGERRSPEPVVVPERWE